MSEEQIRVCLMSQGDWPQTEDLAKRMPGGSLDQGDIVFTTDQTNADVIVVVNYSKYDRLLTARQGYIWNWHNEPIVRRPFAQGYDRVFSHITTTNDPRARTAPPILDWWIRKDYDTLKSEGPPQKPKLMSAIASTKELIGGHKRRNEFIDLLAQHLPAIEIFGSGRPRTLTDKWEGLAPFKYSIAIENTSKTDYWTEKISDCFLSFTVPLYFGATNIGQYFPPESFIWLPVDRPNEAIETVQATMAQDDWEARLPHVIEARERILKNYSLHGQLTRRIRAEKTVILSSPVVTRKIHGRRMRRGGWVRGHGLLGNFGAWWNRRKMRTERDYKPSR